MKDELLKKALRGSREISEIAKETVKKMKKAMLIDF